MKQVVYQRRLYVMKWQNQSFYSRTVRGEIEWWHTTLSSILRKKGFCHNWLISHDVKACGGDNYHQTGLEEVDKHQPKFLHHSFSSCFFLLNQHFQRNHWGIRSTWPFNAIPATQIRGVCWPFLWFLLLYVVRFNFYDM